VTKKMLEKYNAVKIVEENPEELMHTFYDYYRLFKNNALPVANEEVVELYDRKTLTYELAKEFNLLVDIE
jgi:hypothetical protein